ncbi:MAG: response regulator [Oscillochloris sp.]|nr:response regulator [Oscillochloris sp.]
MTIHLPILENAQEAAAVAASEQEPEELPCLNLLIVDDDVSISKSLQGLLERIGHKVTIYADALSALDAYKARGFDVVLSDVAMPGMNGIELLRELRAYDPDSRVLLFTGQALPKLIEEAGRAGALSVLHKPFELNEVLKAIRSAYFHRRAAAVGR